MSRKTKNCSVCGKLQRTVYYDKCRTCSNRAKRGIPFSDEIKLNMSAAKKGKPLSKEFLRAGKIAFKGHHHTPEARARIKASALLRWEESRIGLADTEKRCSKCREIRDISEFHKDRGARDGLFSSCKQCAKVSNHRLRDNPEFIKKVKIRQNKWRKEKPEKVLATAHRRRAREKAGGKWEGDEWNELIYFYSPDGECLRCNTIVGISNLTVDHVTPLNIGGANTVDNLQPLCKSCNSKKSRTVPEDYRPDMGIFAKFVKIAFLDVAELGFKRI